MHTTQLELEIVTPMFLHGHDPNLLELRPPPFKALFRYWWRASQSITNADNLRKEEGKLFGNTCQRAPLQIRIPSPDNLESDEHQPLPHHTGGKGCVNCPPGEGCRKDYPKDAYCPDQQFKIMLTADDIADYVSVVKLSFLLGGVGNRSRRGFGSVRDTNWRFKYVCDLRTEILQTLHDVGSPRDFDINTCGNIESRLITPNYPVIRQIFFGQPNSDFQSLLKTIGQATHDCYDSANNALGQARGQQRMASPIHVSVQKVGQDYLPIVTQLHWNYPGYTSADLTKQQDFIDQIIS